MPKVELCIETISELDLAIAHKFDRVELCGALDIGGITPSKALIAYCAPLIETHVIIRPRPGNFVYTQRELELMKADIAETGQLGAKGVVFGVLDADTRVDKMANLQLLEFAQSMKLACTFHRAFDHVLDPMIVAREIAELGFDRLLTSGREETAAQGLVLIRSLVEQFGNKIEIMAGSGINPENAASIVETGVHAIHFTARQPSKISLLGMGRDMLPDDEKVRGIFQAIGRQ